MNLSMRGTQPSIYLNLSIINGFIQSKQSDNIFITITITIDNQVTVGLYNIFLFIINRSLVQHKSCANNSHLHYTGILLACFFHTFALKGFFGFAPKFLENYYGIPKFKIALYGKLNIRLLVTPEVIEFSSAGRNRHTLIHSACVLTFCFF